MSIHDDIGDVLLLIGRLQEAVMTAGEEQEAALWSYIRQNLFYISRTGQVYRLEDYLKSVDSTRTSFVGQTLASCKEATLQQAISLLLRTLNEVTDPGEKRLVIMIIDTMNFIAESGQWGDFEEFFKSYHVDAASALLYFETRAEAEEWLRSASKPPSWAQILVGNEYFEAWYYREDNERKLLRSNIIGLFLEDFDMKGFPPAVASFHTLEEAREWLKANPATPMSFIDVAGEVYFAVYQRKLNRHSLHHVANTLAEWREEKKRRTEQQQP